MLDVVKLLSKLKGVSIEWRKNGAAALMKRLDAVFADRVPGRETYKLPDGSTTSIYSEDNAVIHIEISLDIFPGTESLTDLEYEDKVDEFFEKFNAAVVEAAGILGDPQFNDGFGCEGFPDDQDAVWLALWNVSGSRVMIQQKHEARELPFRLLLVLAPPV